jgi:hypothetical protein
MLLTTDDGHGDLSPLPQVLVTRLRADTLNRACSRSLRLLTTRRFSFSEWAPRISSSHTITPTTTATSVPARPGAPDQLSEPAALASVRATDSMR